MLLTARFFLWLSEYLTDLHAWKYTTEPWEAIRGKRKQPQAQAD